MRSYARRKGYKPSVKPIGQSAGAKLVGGGPESRSIQAVLAKDSQGVCGKKPSGNVVLVCTIPFTDGKLGAWVDLLYEFLEAWNQRHDARVWLVVLRVRGSDPRFVDIGLVLPIVS